MVTSPRIRDVCTLTPCPICLTTAPTSLPGFGDKPNILKITVIELAADALFKTTNTQLTSAVEESRLYFARHRPQIDSFGAEQ